MESFFNSLENKYNSESSANKDELDDLRYIYNLAGKRGPVKTPDKSEEWKLIENRLSEDRPLNKKVFFPKFIKIAASFLILIVSGWFIYSSVLKPKVFETSQQIKNITLADGSEITLNKHSRLKVKSGFNKQSRMVFLTGEAYFKVTKAEHPFIIKTEVAQVKVVGTQFNLKAKDSKVELAVNEGIVDFSNIHDVDSSIRITKGFLSVCTKAGKPDTPQKIELDDYPGWIHGKFTFQNNTLNEICEELALNLNIDIEIQEDSIANKMITGTLDSSDSEEIMQILCTLTHQNYKIAQNKYVIY